MVPNCTNKNATAKSFSSVLEMGRIAYSDHPIIHSLLPINARMINSSSLVAHISIVHKTFLDRNIDVQTNSDAR